MPVGYMLQLAVIAGLWFMMDIPVGSEPEPMLLAEE